MRTNRTIKVYVLFKKILGIRYDMVLFIVLVFIFNLDYSQTYANAGPTPQQEQELLLLDALNKRQAVFNGYGTSNSLMDMLERSKLHNLESDGCTVSCHKVLKMSFQKNSHST